MDRLVRTSQQIYCPFKGQASYYSLVNGPENAVWSYEAPYDEMMAISGLLAFYPDKVDSITTASKGRQRSVRQQKRRAPEHTQASLSNNQPQKDVIDACATDLDQRR